MEKVVSFPMLVLTRKADQSIMIGDNIEIVVSSIDGNAVRIGIKAPKDVKILRKETFEAVRLQNLRAIEDAARYNEQLGAILRLQAENGKKDQQ